MKKEKYENIKNKNVKIIDVRTRQEYESGHLPKSRNIPFDELINYYNNFLNKKETYYIYCKNGNLSKRAVAILSYLEYNVIMLVI